VRNLVFGSAFAVSACAIAACGGGTTVVTPGPGPTCSPGETVQMVYPIPGATGVPDNPQQIVFAMASPLPSSWDLAINNSDVLNANTAFTIAGMQTITAGQVPSPSATPAIPNPVYQSVTLASGFTSGQTIYVWLNDRAAANNCTPLGPLGSFTTQ